MQTSKLLRDILQQHSGERIYLRDLLAEMGERSFAGLLMICALPEALPLPVAGVSAIIGIPLIIVSLQLLLGFRKPWLPSWIAKRSFKRQDVEKLFNKILSILEKYERVIRPRWKLVTNRNAQRLLGLLLLILAFIIALPIPFGNMIPAIIIIIISLGMIEQDGLVIALGACLSFILFAAIAYALLALRQFIPQFNLNPSGGANLAK